VDRRQTSLQSLDRVTVILHRPATPENIGSVARAMANTGFSRLIISSPETEDWGTAGKVAVSAVGILENAPKCASLAESLSLAAPGFVVGTTGRDRKYWAPIEIAEAAPAILSRAVLTGVALLFGPENTGLSNGELALCQMVVTIPSAGSLSSYNLSHAAILTLFQIMTAATPEENKPLQTPAAFDSMEGMYTHIRETLTEAGFLWEDNPAHMMHAVRSFINRAAPTEQEAKMVRGICRKLLRHLRDR